MGRIRQPMHNLCASNCPPLTPLQLPMAQPPMRDRFQMNTRIKLHSSKTCMTIATAKPPVLIITSLMSLHPDLTAIAFQYLIIMIGHPQCSHYNTVFMLLHVIESL
jgi:hypothetical protein